MLNTEQGEDLVLIHDGVLEFLETKYLENMSNCPGDHSDITDLESCMCRLEYTEIKLHLLFSFFLGENFIDVYLYISMLEMLASVQKVFISVGQISQEASLFDSTACSLWDTGLVAIGKGYTESTGLNNLLKSFC